VKKKFCYTATYLRNITCTTKVAEGLDGCAKPAGSRGRALVGGRPRSLRILKVVTSKFYAFFGCNSHTIHEIKTLIIENENYEAQLQSANSAPIPTTFIQHMKIWVSVKCGIAECGK